MFKDSSLSVANFPRFSANKIVGRDRKRTLSLEARLQPVRQVEPFFARCRGEAAQGADHVLAGTLGSVHGLDEEIVSVGFSLVRLGGPTEVQRPLYKRAQAIMSMRIFNPFVLISNSGHTHIENKRPAL